MREGLIETTVVPRNPLDVLAQQIVAIAALVRGRPVTVDDLYALVTRTYTYAELSRAQLENVLDMLDGRYPSEEFGELRARIVWDRVAGTIRARKGARALAITNAGTIPDRGLFASTSPTAAASASSTRRWSTRRGPARSFLLGASTLADRGDHPRPRDRHARAGRPGRGAVLARRQRRPPARARRGDRRVRPLGGRAGRRRRSSDDYDLDPLAAAEPARLPARAAGGDARRPERPHDRHRALPRRDRRLAAVRPLALRRARPRRLGPRAQRADPRASTASSPTRSGPTTGSSSTCPTRTSRPAPSSC